MADKPSKALVLYGDGLARSIDPAQTHIHSFASRALCGFLALPNSPSSENEDTRIIREFAQLLDSDEAYHSVDEKELFADSPQEKYVFPTAADRFMGMKAAIITDNLSLKHFGEKLGLTVLQWEGLFNNINSLPPVASELLKLLGFENGKTLDVSQFDLVFVRVGVNEKIKDLKNIEYLNNLVGELVHTAQTGTDIYSQLHMSVILSYGATHEDDNLKFPVTKTEPENGRFSELIPCQSYMMKGGKPRKNIRQYCPMLLAQYQNAVTRKDMVETFSFKDFLENGGNLVIPADRFQHEVAFKLWKSPKYGA